MESRIVIKVKFGDTLRRFNALIYDNEQLEFDMDTLRTKILALFSLSTDTDLTLTYTDEDGDLVTLVDDDDLCDVMRQGLNPFRINVLVNINKSSGSRLFARSSGSSTPKCSPQVHQPFQNVTCGVAEVLNSVPEPFREAISKMTLDAASKAVSSAPQLTELVEMISKIGQSYLFPGAQSQDGDEQNGVSCRNKDMSFTKETNSSKGGDMPEVASNSTFAGLTSKGNQKVDTGNGSKSVAAPVTPASVDLNLKIPGEYISSGTTTVNLVPAASNVNNFDNWRERGEGSNGHISDLSGIIGPNMGSADPTRGYCSGASQLTKSPFSGMPPTDDSVIAPVAHPRIHPFKRFHKYSEGMRGIFHRGVQCDGCGVHPITGPRFKSKVKEDYDLCSICFSAMGNEADYIRMDHPTILPLLHPKSERFYHPVHYPRYCPGLNSGRKLDSRFILDVNVIDGTMLAPSTSFSKIWRMRNSGSLVWPRGTQLVWIGGERFSNAVSVEIEVPANGVAVEQEFDIAVDFVAPEQPGRYISYWRLASPSGQKFGQRVWVLIQVDASLKESFCDIFHGLNLNLPPVSFGSEGPIMIDVNVEPIVDCGFPDPPNSNTVVEPIEPMVGEQPTKDEEENFPINDSLLVGDVSEPVPAQALTPAVDVNFPAPPEHGNENNIIEQTLLKELDCMGFKQVNLNKEILRTNEYNLEQSVDDLCGVAEWDPILEELDEMGFYDRVKNKQLLKKNNGSIKRVVMDLIAGEE